MVLFAGNTVWSISERVRGICVDALYKSKYTLLCYSNTSVAEYSNTIPIYSIVQAPLSCNISTRLLLHLLAMHLFLPTAVVHRGTVSRCQPTQTWSEVYESGPFSPTERHHTVGIISSLETSRIVFEGVAGEVPRHWIGPTLDPTGDIAPAPSTDWLLHCESKKHATILLSVTSQNVDRFSKFFHKFRFVQKPMILNVLERKMQILPLVTKQCFATGATFGSSYLLT